MSAVQTGGAPAQPEAGGEAHPAAARREQAGAVGAAANGGFEVEHLLGYRLRRAHGLFMERWRVFFDLLGLALTPVQGGIVLLIERHPRLTQSELARRLGIEAPTLHASIKRLIAAGLVGQGSNAADRRAHALELTASGHAAARLIRSHIGEQEARALAPLTAVERDELARLLDRVLAGA